MFNPLSHPICFSNLLRIAPSTWIGHTPFAMFLTDLLRPRIITELGTYYGTSYCAFCQAVDQLKLDTKCYAIDTWRGDPQSGFFGDEVLEDLRAYHDRLYGKFSRLIQSTFDEAIVHFEDGSIDLLHIDGFHTYDEVKKDFEKWLPKTSGRAVVLFHDINVREKDFGVWQFWKETQSEYPSFEFLHSHGLGILAVGKKCPQTVIDFIRFANENSTTMLDFFYQLGMRLEVMLENQGLRQSAYNQNKEIENNTEQLNILRALEQEVADKTAKLEIKERNIQEKILQFESRELELQKKTELTLAELQTERNSIEMDRQTLLAENQKLFAKMLEAQKCLNDLVTGSTNNHSLIKLLESRFDEIVSSSDDQVFKLVIGIVTYNNSQDQLDHLLKSISLAIDNVDQMRLAFEMHVIDNGQKTLWPDSNIKIAKHDSLGNVGFGRGMNHLMAHAFADPETQWFLCLNPDGVLHYQALNELLKTIRSNPHSLVEARQFPEEHLKNYDPHTLETRWASGACLLIPKDVYQVTNGFDPNFFMYLEDVDLSWRARSAGFTVKMSPNALFGHSVLDRIFDPVSDKTFLLSGRYLGHKWKNKNFVGWTEEELVGRGYYASHTALPELPEVLDDSHLDTKIADFEHYFHFSPVRW